MSEEKKGFFSRLKQGLTKTRNNIVHGMDSVFKGYSHIDEDFYEELEEVLIMGDIGVNATGEIMERLRKQVKEQRIKEPHECRELLIENIKEQMKVGETAYEFENTQSVILVIGVNGVGKTTSVGKLAGKLKDNGKRVLIAAADTFRAAAVEQLEEWTKIIYDGKEAYVYSEYEEIIPMVLQEDGSYAEYVDLEESAEGIGGVEDSTGAESENEESVEAEPETQE